MIACRFRAHSLTWQTEPFAPFWEMKDVIEAQPLKLFVDYQKQCLVDASDPEKVYANIVTIDSRGHVEPTTLSKA